MSFLRHFHDPEHVRNVQLGPGMAGEANSWAGQMEGLHIADLKAYVATLRRGQIPPRGEDRAGSGAPANRGE
jgi:hypothetical protein